MGSHNLDEGVLTIAENMLDIISFSLSNHKMFIQSVKAIFLVEDMMHAQRTTPVSPCTNMCTCKHSNSLYTVIIHSLEIFVLRVRIGSQVTVNVNMTNDNSECFVSSGKVSLFRVLNK